MIQLIDVAGPGDDVMLGGPGGERFVWNPGDASDRIEGGAGSDTLEFNGSDAAETWRLRRTGRGSASPATSPAS